MKILQTGPRFFTNWILQTGCLQIGSIPTYRNCLSEHNCKTPDQSTAAERPFIGNDYTV